MTDHLYQFRPGFRAITRKRLLRGEPEPVGYPTPITWTEFAPDGGERLVTGAIWALAKPIAGNRSVWVIAEDSDHIPIRVVITTKRHQVGRARAGRYVPRAGRYVDVGERYVEADHRSPTGHSAYMARQRRGWARNIRTVPLPDIVHQLLSTPPQ